jgi:hypothetical protein
MPDDDWLTDEVIAAVARHMNDDHAADNVVICRGSGGRPHVHTARLTGLDRDAVEFTATEPGGDVVVRVPFSRPLTERAQIRAEVARMFDESAAALGLPAREH